MPDDPSTRKFGGKAVKTLARPESFSASFDEASTRTSSDGTSPEVEMVPNPLSNAKSLFEEEDSAGRGSSAGDAPAAEGERVSISRFWAALALLLQVVLLAVSVNALSWHVACVEDSLTYQDPVHNKTCAGWSILCHKPDTGLTEEQAAEVLANCPGACGLCDRERTEFWFYVADTVYPLGLLGLLLVLMYDPVQPFGFLQLVSSLMVISQRAMLHWIQRDDRRFLVEPVAAVVPLAIIAYARHRQLLATFAPQDLDKFVFSTVPTALVSALMSVLFVSGETASCLLDKLNDHDNSDFGCRNEEDDIFANIWCKIQKVDGGKNPATGQKYSCNFDNNMCQCYDTMTSNEVFSYMFVSAAFAQIMILPFLPTQYTVDHLFRFDLMFSEQVQIIVSGLGAVAALWMFASSSDAGYTDDLQPLTSFNGRASLQRFVTKTIVIVLFTSIVSEFSKSKNAMPCLTKITERIRGSMRTRSRTKFAPAVRYVLMFMVILSWAPLVIELWFQIQVKTGSSNFVVNFAEDAEKIGQMYAYCGVVTVTFASFNLLSNLASNARWDRTVYVISITIMCTLAGVTTGYLVFDDNASEDSKGLGFEEWTPLALANVVLIFSGAIGIFFVMNIGREYIGLHSEAQVNMHMQQSVKVIMAVIGPIIFLFSETMASNFVTVLQFSLSAIFFLGTEISNQHLTRQDKIAMRGVDVGVTCRGFLIALTWFLALVAFGSRPREVTRLDLQNYDDNNNPAEAKAEMKIVVVATIIGYLVVGIWFVIVAWERHHIKHKINTDNIMSRTSSTADASAASIGQRAWKGLWEGLTAWLLKHEVKNEEPRASGLFTAMVAACTWTATVPIVVSVLAIIVEGGDSKYAVLGYRLWMMVKCFCFTSAAVYCFMDLRETRGVGYAHFHASIVVFASAAETIAVSQIYSTREGITNSANMLFSVGCAVWAIVQRGRALRRSPGVRRKHVYTTVVHAALAVGTPLVVITSEVAVCWLRASFECVDEDVSCMKHSSKCDGVAFGANPLVWLMVLTSMHTVFYMDAKDTLALNKIARLKLDVLSGLQFAIFGSCAIYAVVKYAMRDERDVDWSGSAG
ncbi:hypothetical protein TeGR_g9945, partial [Tetraparma gracilis]